jgi:hypothetical protein
VVFLFYTLLMSYKTFKLIKLELLVNFPWNYILLYETLVHIWNHQIQGLLWYHLFFLLKCFICPTFLHPYSALHNLVNTTLGTFACTPIPPHTHIHTHSVPFLLFSFQKCFLPYDSTSFEMTLNIIISQCSQYLMTLNVFITHSHNLNKNLQSVM